MATIRFDPFSGASGDMVLGALLDAGLEIDYLRDQLRHLPIDGYTIESEQIERHAVRGTRVRVDVADAQPARTWADIRRIIGASQLAPPIQATALSIFQTLAVAEAAVHNQPIDTIHFHEVGSVDAIVDICGVAIGFDALGVTTATSAPIRPGSGFVRAQHGLMPVPAPATTHIIANAQMPVLPMPAGHEDLQAELLTPTGAAILATMATFVPQTFTATRVAHGFGQRELPWPNALRLWIDDGSAGTPPSGSEGVLLIETNIDDMNPQLFELVTERLFAAGVLDCWLTPIQMKKSRPGTLLSVLARADQRVEIERIILTNTTTLGVRYSPVERTILDRQELTIATRFGDVRLKLAIDHGRVLRARPEYEDCAALARLHAVPLSDVWDDAHRLGVRLVGREATTLE